MLSGEPSGNKKYSIRMKCIILKCVCVCVSVHVAEAAGIKTCVNVILISGFRHVLNVVCFLLGESPASEIYMPTFRNTVPVPSS